MRLKDEIVQNEEYFVQILNYLNPQGGYTTRKRSALPCPCHTGDSKGSNSFSWKDEAGTIKGQCHNPGCQLNGFSNIIDLFMKANNITDFTKGKNEVAEICGIPIPEYKPAPTEIGTLSYKNTKEDDIPTIIEKAHARVEETDYFTRRGLSDKTINDFKLGYMPKCTFKGYDNGPGAIIPYPGEDYYFTRLINPTGDFKCLKLHGSSPIFNARCIQDSDIIWVTEGQFDALSLIELGFAAISTDSASSIQKLIDYIETNNINDKVFIIAFDNDSAGYAGSVKLISALEERGITAIRYKPSKANDINDMLVNHTEQLVEDTATIYAVAEKLGSEPFMRHVYNFIDVKQTIEEEGIVYLVSNKTNCDYLISRGFCATTTTLADEWDDNYTSELDRANIVYLPDTTERGDRYKKAAWFALKDHINSFKIVELKNLKDLGTNKTVVDWLEAGHSYKELYASIKDGWDWCISPFWKDLEIKEKKDGSVVKIPLKTAENIEILLNRHDTTLKYNIISKEIEAQTTRFDNKNLNTLATEILDQCDREGLKVSRDRVINAMTRIAHKNEYDPFKEYLDGLKDKWDNVSRIQEYIDCFHTSSTYNLQLKDIIFHNWLMQFVDSTYNDDFKSQGMLVMKGDQGIYKTTSMSYLIPSNEKWAFLSEQKYTDNRDCIQTLTSSKLTELSEFARSAKAVDSLKGFVTAPVDKMVLKYDKFPTDYKRMTVFYATVNDDNFLIDDENRRFWVVDIESIDIDKLKEFDYDQLWAEMYYIYHVLGETKCYLDNEERQMLENSNRNYQYEGDNSTQLQLVFDFNGNIQIWLRNEEINDFMNLYSGKAIPKSVLGRELKKLGIKGKEINNKQMPRATYYPIPIPREWHGRVKEKWSNRLVDDTPKTEQVAIDNNVVKLEFANKKKNDKVREDWMELSPQERNLRSKDGSVTDPF